jgi:D-alanine transaminase
LARVAYVNGRYLPHAQAAVHIEDRAYQFADGVYEVCEVRSGRLIDEGRHLERLERSLREIGMTMPLSPVALGAILRELALRNRIVEGLVYLQIGRGVAQRDHAFPATSVRPSLVVTARTLLAEPRRRRMKEGIAVITVPDDRWARVDVKTVGLLPNVLAKQKAREAGAWEAWFVDKAGRITEGTSSNAWIVTDSGTVVTRNADRAILRGTARGVVLDLAGANRIALEERPFSFDEARHAREAFITSATTAVTPVVKIDGTLVGDGRPGKVTRQLQEAFYRFAEVAPLRSTPTSS